MSAEVRDLFQYIERYKPHEVELESTLKCFIPEYIPAIGEMDAFIKVILLFYLTHYWTRKYVDFTEECIAVVMALFLNKFALTCILVWGIQYSNKSHDNNFICHDFPNPRYRDRIKKKRNWDLNSLMSHPPLNLTPLCLSCS